MDLIPYLYFFQDYLISPVTNYPKINDIDLLFDYATTLDPTVGSPINNCLSISMKLTEKINAIVSQANQGNYTLLQEIYGKICNLTGLNLDFNIFSSVISRLELTQMHNEGLKKAGIKGAISQYDPVTKKITKKLAIIDMNYVESKDLKEKPLVDDRNYMELEGTKFKIIKKAELLKDKLRLVEKYEKVLKEQSSEEAAAKAIDIGDKDFAKTKVDNWRAQIALLETPELYNVAIPVDYEQLEIIYGIIIFLELLDQTILELGFNDLNLKISGGLAAHMHSRSFLLQLTPEERTVFMMQYQERFAGGTEEDDRGGDAFMDQPIPETEQEAYQEPVAGGTDEYDRGGDAFMNQPIPETEYFQTGNAGGYRGGTKRRRKSKRKSKSKKNKKRKSKKYRKTRKH